MDVIYQKQVKLTSRWVFVIFPPLAPSKQVKSPIPKATSWLWHAWGVKALENVSKMLVVVKALEMHSEMHWLAFHQHIEFDLGPNDCLLEKKYIYSMIGV